MLVIQIVKNWKLKTIVYAQKIFLSWGEVISTLFNVKVNLIISNLNTAASNLPLCAHRNLIQAAHMPSPSPSALGTNASCLDAFSQFFGIGDHIQAVQMSSPSTSTLETIFRLSQFFGIEDHIQAIQMPSPSTSALETIFRLPRCLLRVVRHWEPFTNITQMKRAMKIS